MARQIHHKFGPVLFSLAAVAIASDPVDSSKRMADGRQWMTQNLNVSTTPSWCYGDEGKNCGQYGRLYMWDSAQRACRSLGNGWRLPTDQEWRLLAKHYGGVSQDSQEGGHAAYAALISGGNSGFNAVLGGGRAQDGEFARLDAHGFYWTATENNAETGYFYNFGRGGLALHRQAEGEKERAFSVRCIRE